MANLYALILAGGASARFWPLSGDEHPKYLLRVGEHTLLEHAWQRALCCTQESMVVAVTGTLQAARVAGSLPGLHTENLIVEPARRDTAAAIALGVRHIHSRDPDAWILVLPADQLIEPVDALAAGIRRALATPGAQAAIHVFGVTPTRAEGGFGYIRPGAALSPGVAEVGQFVEKPGATEADRLVLEGWLWNAGCFLFTADAFGRELSAHMPAHSARLKPVSVDTTEPEDYEGLESISIDYGLIEKASSLRVIELAAEFDDIGTWDALLKRLPPDSNRAISVDGQNNRATGAQVAVVGESNLLVVVHDGKVLVLKQGHGHAVKQVKQQETEPAP